MGLSFKNFRLNVIVRAVALTATIFGLVKLAQSGNYFVVIVAVWALILYQIYSLIKMVENTNHELIDFLNSIRYDDFSRSYKLSEEAGSFTELNRAFNRVLDDFRRIRSNKEAEFHYLKNIIQHIGIGIISFDRTGKVQIANTAAKRLFKVNQLTQVDELATQSEELVAQFYKLRTGSKALVRLRREGEVVQLAIYAIELYLKGEEYKLVTVQNIHSELEEKEMEAWQGLIRVLTHEIMNSVTPITSLAATLEGEMEYIRESGGAALTTEDLDDVQLAIRTIRSRSEALIRFVNDFRYMTRVPEPRIAPIRVKEMFEHIQALLLHDFQQKGIRFACTLEPEALILTADRDLIEQVLINLLKNAAEALEDHEELEDPKQVTLSAWQNEGNQTYIAVKDNGPGIDPDALERIFIPFFTTKKSGSGIGLSLSRKIMRQHNGSLSVQTEVNQGTEFRLKF